jgi:hypothetical protein
MPVTFIGFQKAGDLLAASGMTFLPCHSMIRECCRRVQRHAVTHDRDSASSFLRGEVSLQSPCQHRMS